MASFYDVTLGRRREEHHDHAVVSGRLAGGNMAGANKAYTHQSMFWSDLGPNVGYEAIGLIDASLPTVGIWAAASPADTPAGVANGAASPSDSSPTEDTDSAEGGAVDTRHGEPVVTDLSSYAKGVVFYMRDDAVVGVVLWNMFGKIPLARKIIRSEKKFSDARDLAKIFRVHEKDPEAAE